MRFFRFQEAEKKTDAILKLEWILLGGGFLNMGKNNWTFCHRLLRTGNAMFGTEKEFVIRAQIALDFEPRFSWFSCESWRSDDPDVHVGSIPFPA